MFTPASRLCQSPVNPESITAAGTLLMNWLAKTGVSSGWLSIRPPRTDATSSILATFPVNTNRNTKVSRRL
jgi:hypothetical protein